MSAWIEKFINVNGYARSGKKLTSVRKLVVHYTANPGASAENHYRYFGNLNDRYASAHIFVDKTQAINIIPLNEVAYHAGDIQKRNANGTPYRGVKELLPSANNLSIGIEMCIEKDGTFHPDTISRTVDVFVDLCKKYDLDPVQDIVRHYDVTAKNCPAPWVSNNQLFADFKNRVKAQLGGKTVSISPSHPLLKKGDNCAAVSELQTLLNKKGYKLVVDSDFGNATDSALRDFQSKNGLDVDGVCGNNTWNKLTYVAPAIQTPPVTKTPPVVKPKLNGWVKENSVWYFYENDQKKKGWVKDKGIWYYLDTTTGAMKTGWVDYKGKKFYCLRDGAMVTGWQCVEGKWYCFDENEGLIEGTKLAANITVNADGSISKIENK